MSIENDDIDLGKAIFIPTKTKKSPTDTKTSYGIAKSDSSNGSVTVDMLGLTSGDSQDVEMPCTCAVKEGERVIVTIVGTDPIVTGVAGWGDLVQKDAEDALSQAKAAVKQVDVEYAVGDSQSTAPTSGWSTSTPEWTSGKYIWQRTVISTSDGTTYSDPTCIQGAQGEAGKDGTSVTIESTSTTYQASTNGTTTPTGTWSDTIPSVAAGSYLWTKAVVVYSDGTSTETFTVALQGKTGSKGSSGTTYYTWIKYADTPTSGMSDNPDGKTYLGVAYNKTTATESTAYSDYSWSLIKGENGTDGNGISSVAYLYARTTTQTQPAASAITSTTIPTLDATNRYLWQKETTAFTNGTTQINIALLGVYGDTGKQGDKGATGTGVSSITPQYYLSTSSSSATGGTWQTSPPTYVSGRYYWTRNKIVWQNPTSTSYTTAVYDPSLTEALSSVVQLKTLIRETDDGVEVGKSSDGSTYTGAHTLQGTDGFYVHDKNHNVIGYFKGDDVGLAKGYGDGSVNMFGDGVSLVGEYDVSSGGNYYVARLTAGNRQAAYGTQYYLASSKSSGVTRYTSGWSTSHQVPTSSKPYVWWYWKTSSGTVSTPKIIGVYTPGDVTLGGVELLGGTSQATYGSVYTGFVGDGSTTTTLTAATNAGSAYLGINQPSSGDSQAFLEAKQLLLTGTNQGSYVIDNIIKMLNANTRTYCGSGVWSLNAVDSSHSTCVLWSDAQIKQIIGENWDVTRMCCNVMNGDTNATAAIWGICTCWDPAGHMNLMCNTSQKVSGNVRINYTITVTNA